METLVIHSRSRSNLQLLSALAQKMGEKIEINSVNKKDNIQTGLAFESAWAKDWLTPEEDEAWKDL